MLNATQLLNALKSAAGFRYIAEPEHDEAKQPLAIYLKRALEWETDKNSDVPYGNPKQLAAVFRALKALEHEVIDRDAVVGILPLLPSGVLMPHSTLYLTALEAKVPKERHAPGKIPAWCARVDAYLAGDTTSEPPFGKLEHVKAFADVVVAFASDGVVTPKELDCLVKLLPRQAMGPSKADAWLVAARQQMRPTKGTLAWGIGGALLFLILGLWLGSVGGRAQQEATDNKEETAAVGDHAKELEKAREEVRTQMNGQLASKEAELNAKQKELDEARARLQKQLDDNKVELSNLKTKHGKLSTWAQITAQVNSKQSLALLATTEAEKLKLMSEAADLVSQLPKE